MMLFSAPLVMVQLETLNGSWRGATRIISASLRYNGQCLVFNACHLIKILTWTCLGIRGSFELMVATSYTCIFAHTPHPH